MNAEKLILEINHILYDYICRKIEVYQMPGKWSAMAYYGDLGGTTSVEGVGLTPTEALTCCRNNVAAMYRKDHNGRDCEPAHQSRF